MTAQPIYKRCRHCQVPFTPADLRAEQALGIHIRCMADIAETPVSPPTPGYNNGRCR